MAPPVSAIKLNINVRPDTHPSFESYPRNKKLHIWGNWNYMRAQHNLAAVPYPDPNVVTHKPWKGITADPNVTPHPNVATPPNRTTNTTQRPTTTTNRPSTSTRDPNRSIMDEFDEIDREFELINRTTPSSSGTKRRPENPDLEGEMSGRNKVRRLDTNTRDVGQPQEEVASMDTSGPGASASADNIAQSQGGNMTGALSTQSGDEMFVARPISSSNPCMLKFNKVHKMLTYGLEFANLASGDERFMTTSLHEVPWDRLWFYMDYAEFASLPQGAKAIKAEIKIVQRNTRVSFEIGSTTSGLATLNQNKFGVKAIDLPAKIRGSNYAYTYDPAKPMTPTNATEKSYEFVPRALYGWTPSNAQYDSWQPVHTLGIPYHLNSYFTLRSNSVAYKTNNPTKITPGWGHYSQFVEEYDMNDFIGDVIHEQTYHFSCAPITSPIQAIHQLPSVGAEVFPVQDNQMQQRYVNTVNPGPDQPQGAGVQGTSNTALNMTYSNAINGFSSIDQIIEKSAFYSSLRNQPKVMRQPSIHIGVKPIPKLTAFNWIGQSNTDQDLAENFSDVEAYFEVSCTLHVSISHPTEFAAYEGQSGGNTQVLPGLSIHTEEGLYNVANGVDVNKPLLYGQFSI